MRNNMKIDYPCGVKVLDQLLFTCTLSDCFQEAASPPGVPWASGGPVLVISVGMENLGSFTSLNK